MIAFSTVGLVPYMAYFDMRESKFQIVYHIWSNFALGTVGTYFNASCANKTCLTSGLNCNNLFSTAGYCITKIIITIKNLIGYQLP